MWERGCCVGGVRLRWRGWKGKGGENRGRVREDLWDLGGLLIDRKREVMRSLVRRIEELLMLERIELDMLLN